MRIQPSPRPSRRSKKPPLRRKTAARGSTSPSIWKRARPTGSNSPSPSDSFSGFELNGNGAQLINIARGQTLHILDSNRVTVRDLTIDYDPLRFTQGTIA